MNQLLAYSIITNPFPLQASAPSGSPPNVAQLTIVATNNTVSDVTLQGIIVSIPVGESSTQMTTDAKDIGPVPPTNWVLQQTSYPPGFVQFEFLPSTGYGTLGSNSSLNFIFNNIQVNDQTGAVEIDVTEGSNNCVPPGCPVIKLSITKFPDGWGQVSFWASAPVIPSGSGATVNWSGPSGAKYVLEYYTPQSGIINVPAQGASPLANNGQYSTDPPIVLTSDTEFTLTVKSSIGGQQYQAQNQVRVTVAIPLPQITMFKGVAALVSGQTVQCLQWNTQYATSCQISGDPHPVNLSSLDDSYVISPDQFSPTYMLTATNAAGSINSTIAPGWLQVYQNQFNKMGFIKTMYFNGQQWLIMLSEDFSGSNMGSLSVYQITGNTTSPLQAIGQSVNVGAIPRDFAISPDGTKICVICGASNRSAVLCNVTGNASNPILVEGNPLPLGKEPLSAFFTPDGSKVLVTAQGSQEDMTGFLLLLNLTGDPTNPLSVTGSPLQYGGSPSGAAFADGQRVVVTDSNGTQVAMFKLTGSASMPFQMIGSPVAVGGNPLRLYVNGSIMFSANMDGTICMLQVSQDNTAPLKVLAQSQSFGQRVINTAAYNSNNSMIFFLLDWRGGTFTVVLSPNNSSSPFQIAGNVYSMQYVPDSIVVSPDGETVLATSMDESNPNIMPQEYLSMFVQSF